MKHWITSAVAFLETSLGSVPHELNELDWKHSLSNKKDRLVQHLSAFANYPNGGVMVFGVDEQTNALRGMDQGESESIIGQLANLGRDALEPPVTLDHAIVDFRGTALLLIYVKEIKVKPVYLRGKPLVIASLVAIGKADRAIAIPGHALAHNSMFNK